MNMKNQTIATTILFLLLPIGALAQTHKLELPVQHFDRKEFFVESLALTTSNVMDLASTVRDSQMGIAEASFPRGGAELLGKYPGAAKCTLIMGLGQLGTELIAYRFEHSRNRFVRATGHAFMNGSTADHLRGFGNNLLVQRQYGK